MKGAAPLDTPQVALFVLHKLRLESHRFTFVHPVTEREPTVVAVVD
jgi:hypothetical protein